MEGCTTEGLIFTRIRTIPISWYRISGDTNGIGTRTPLYSHVILVYYIVPGQVLSHPFPSPTNTIRQLNSGLCGIAAMTSWIDWRPSLLHPPLTAKHCCRTVHILFARRDATSWRRHMTVSWRRVMMSRHVVATRYHHACGIWYHQHGRYRLWH